LPCQLKIIKTTQETPSKSQKSSKNSTASTPRMQYKNKNANWGERKKETRERKAKKDDKEINTPFQTIFSVPAN
jgi:hypothetical protein